MIDTFLEMAAIQRDMAHNALMLALFRQPWAEFQDKMRHLEASVKLVAFHTREAATATKGCAYFTNETAFYAKEALQNMPTLGSVAAYLEFREVPVQVTSASPEFVSPEVPGVVSEAGVTN